MNANRTIMRVAGVVAACVLVFSAIPTALGNDNELAYRRQFQALDPTNLEGHMTLAKWCRDEEAWDLLERQCNYVLRLDPKHTTAEIYLQLAKSKQGSSPQTPGNSGVAGGSTKSGQAGSIRELTDEEVQILRRSELLLDRTERVPIKFHNGVLERFWNYMAKRENLTKRDRADFNRLRPAVRKAQTILGRIKDYERASTDDAPFVDEYSQDIEIEKDPAMFREFKHTRVSGVIATSCATSRCHGGTNAGEFVMFNERNMTDGMHYANYLMLHEYRKNGERLINRDDPARSLVLIYGQPKTTGPGTTHPTKVKTVFTNPRHIKYRNLLRWLTHLSLPAPEYGFSLDEPAETTGNPTN